MKHESTNEPVAWMQPDEVHISLWKDKYHTIPLYTCPQNPQRSEDINLSCKSTQARLAASWGYVKAQPEQRSVSEQQEPVAWQDTAKPTELVSAEDWDNIDPQWHWMYRPLYTTPPQRKPLTDEQIETAWPFVWRKHEAAAHLVIVRAIEAAHGIKE